MILQYYGHSFFTLALESGAVFAIDPYGSFYNYPERSVRADVCLITHHHHDHDGVSCLKPGFEAIDQPGVRQAAGARVVGVETCHDERGGALRGRNTFFVVEAEGLRVGHAGDLGHVPTSGQAREIGRLDALLLPVGGYYTIDPETAWRVCDLLKPHVLIPMHYRTAYDEDMPIAALADFLSLRGAEDAQMPLLRVTSGDISERPSVITMAIAEA